MVAPSGINALIPLSGRSPNLAGAVSTGLNIRGQRMEQEEFDRRVKARESAAAENARALAEFESIARGVKKLKPLIPTALGEVPVFVRALDDRITEIESTGGDAQDTKEIRDLAIAGDFNAIRQQFDEVEQIERQLQAQQLGVDVPQSAASAAPKVIGNRLVSATGEVLFEGEPEESIQRDRNGVPRFATGPRQGQVVPGFDVERELTPAEQRAEETARREDEEREETQQARQTEANFLADTATALLNHQGLGRVFGQIQGSFRSQTQVGIDAEAQVDLLISNLALENRQKMKGSGQISDFESKLLGRSATLLDNKRISDELARKELQRIERIFREGIEEAPQAAVDALRQNPELADQFEEKYGYLPPGF